MEDTMQKDENKFRFLIDGFPRNEDNLQGWNTVMDGKADVKFVLFFDCDNQVRPGAEGTCAVLPSRSQLSRLFVHRSASRGV